MLTSKYSKIFILLLESLYSIFQVTQTIQGLELTLLCKVDSMDVIMDFREPFAGIIVTIQDPRQQCIVKGENKMKIVFSIPINACGTLGSKGLGFNNSIRIQQDEALITAQDEFWDIDCLHRTSFKDITAGYTPRYDSPGTLSKNGNSTSFSMATELYTISGRAKEWKVLIVITGVAIVILIAGTIAILFVCLRKKKSRAKLMAYGNLNQNLDLFHRENFGDNNDRNGQLTDHMTKKGQEVTSKCSKDLNNSLESRMIPYSIPEFREFFKSSDKSGMEADCMTHSSGKEDFGQPFKNSIRNLTTNQGSNHLSNSLVLNSSLDLGANHSKMNKTLMIRRKDSNLAANYSLTSNWRKDNQTNKMDHRNTAIDINDHMMLNQDYLSYGKNNNKFKKWFSKNKNSDISGDNHFRPFKRPSPFTNFSTLEYNDYESSHSNGNNKKSSPNSRVTPRRRDSLYDDFMSPFILYPDERVIPSPLSFLSSAPSVHKSSKSSQQGHKSEPLCDDKKLLSLSLYINPLRSKKSYLNDDDTPQGMKEFKLPRIYLGDRPGGSSKIGTRSTQELRAIKDVIESSDLTFTKETIHLKNSRNSSRAKVPTLDDADEQGCDISYYLASVRNKLDNKVPDRPNYYPSFYESDIQSNHVEVIGKYEDNNECLEDSRFTTKQPHENIRRNGKYDSKQTSSKPSSSSREERASRDGTKSNSSKSYREQDPYHWKMTPPRNMSPKSTTIITEETTTTEYEKTRIHKKKKRKNSKERKSPSSTIPGAKEGKRGPTYNKSYETTEVRINPESNIKVGGHNMKSTSLHRENMNGIKKYNPQSFDKMHLMHNHLVDNSPVNKEITSLPDDYKKFWSVSSNAQQSDICHRGGEESLHIDHVEDPFACNHYADITEIILQSDNVSDYNSNRHHNGNKLIATTKPSLLGLGLVEDQLLLPIVPPFSSQYNHNYGFNDMIIGENEGNKENEYYVKAAHRSPTHASSLNEHLAATASIIEKSSGNMVKSPGGDQTMVSNIIGSMPIQKKEDQEIKEKEVPVSPVFKEDRESMNSLSALISQFDKIATGKVVGGGYKFNSSNKEESINENNENTPISNNKVPEKFTRNRRDRTVPSINISSHNSKFLEKVRRFNNNNNQNDEDIKEEDIEHANQEIDSRNFKISSGGQTKIYPPSQGITRQSFEASMHHDL